MLNYLSVKTILHIQRFGAMQGAQGRAVASIAARGRGHNRAAPVCQGEGRAQAHDAYYNDRLLPHSD